MKRHIIILITLASLLGCVKTSPDNMSQYVMTFNPISEVQTKGYVTGTSLFDTAPSDLHETSVTKIPRDIILSAYVHDASGTEEVYFKESVFSRNDEGTWSHTPEYFWPLGSTIDFIGYSTTKPLNKVEYSDGNITDMMRFTIDGTHTQNDILYACTIGGISKESNEAMNMLFKHCQAWIEFVFTVKAGMEDKVIVDGVSLESIYTDGILTISHPFGYTEAEWKFTSSTAKTVLMDDPAGVGGTVIGSDPIYFDMLIPEQQRHGVSVLYRLADMPDIQFSFTLPLSIANWQMSQKYVYEINFSFNSIEVNPSIEEWTDQYEPVNN